VKLAPGRFIVDREGRTLDPMYDTVFTVESIGAETTEVCLGRRRYFDVPHERIVLLGS
jgi:hypothetical protein